jgi:hypothetical protein
MIDIDRSRTYATLPTLARAGGGDMEVALIAIAVSALLALLSPIAFALFLFRRGGEETTGSAHETGS